MTTIPSHRATTNANGHMSDNDWPDLVAAALSLANFTGGVVSIAMPNNGPTWIAAADPTGASFSATDPHNVDAWAVGINDSSSRLAVTVTRELDLLEATALQESLADVIPIAIARQLGEDPE